MADTAIEWAEMVWNCLVGCTRVSLGCGGPHGQGGCYAERMAWRHVLMCRARGAPCKYEGTVHLVGGQPRWTGVVKFDEPSLDLPLRWKAPRRIFVNSMSAARMAERMRFPTEEARADFYVALVKALDDKRINHCGCNEMSW